MRGRIQSRKVLISNLQMKEKTVSLPASTFRRIVPNMFPI